MTPVAIVSRKISPTSMAIGGLRPCVYGSDRMGKALNRERALGLNAVFLQEGHNGNPRKTLADHRHEEARLQEKPGQDVSRREG